MHTDNTNAPNYVNNEPISNVTDSSKNFQVLYFAHQETTRTEEAEDRLLSKEKYKAIVKWIGGIGGVLSILFVIALIIFSASNEPEILTFIVFKIWTPVLLLLGASLVGARFVAGRTTIRKTQVAVKGWIPSERAWEVSVTPDSVHYCVFDRVKDAETGNSRLTINQAPEDAKWQNLKTIVDNLTSKALGGTQYLARTFMFQPKGKQSQRFCVLLPVIDIPEGEASTPNLESLDDGDFEGYIVSLDQWRDLATRAEYALELNGLSKK
jgi:hypothetical protein